MVAVLAVLLLAFLLVRKRVRAGAGAAGDPRRRLLGAWQESLDVLEESGLPDLTYLTSREVATATAERFGPRPGDQVRYLGDAANVAIFSPATPITAHEADAAWATHAGLSRSIRDRLDWRARVGAGLRYHRTSTVRAPVGPAVVVGRRPCPHRRAQQPTRQPRRPRYRPVTCRHGGREQAHEATRHRGGAHWPTGCSTRRSSTSWRAERRPAGRATSPATSTTCSQIAANLVVADVVDAEQVKITLRKLVAQVAGSPLIADLVDPIADAIYDLTAGDDIRLGEVIDRDSVSALVTKLLGMRTLHERLLERTTESPLVATVASKFVTKIIADFVQQNRARAEKLPGMSSLLSLGAAAASKVRSATDRHVDHSSATPPARARSTRCGARTR